MLDVAKGEEILGRIKQIVDDWVKQLICISVYKNKMVEDEYVVGHIYFWFT
ncbi:putative polynucleotide adenylyltransferase [Helianthus annuus]|nr:putative polynucleotide adenylyltransferase [Helianthus annuus]